LLDLLASFFYYWALKAGEASDELAAMGGFSPVATALIAVPLLKEPAGHDVIGFTLMCLGGFTMFFAEKQPLRKMLPKIALASSAFGMSNVLQKIVFNQWRLNSREMASRRRPAFYPCRLRAAGYQKCRRLRLMR